MIPARVRTVALLRLRRGWCSPAVPPPVVVEIREAITDMKAKIGAKPATGEIYLKETFEQDLKAGQVDTSLLTSTLADFDIRARKLALKCVNDAAHMKREKAEEDGVMAAYDWSQWERKGLDAAVIQEVRAIMQDGVEHEKERLPELVKENKLDDLEREVLHAFKGPDGFLDLAGKEETAARAGMLNCLSDMEKLELDAMGLRDVTIAEILEREPQLRAEIEEEIKNNNWGY